MRIITEQQHCVEILPAACKATAECIFQHALQCEDLLSQAEDADTQQWSHCVEIGSCIMKGRGQVHFQTHALHVVRWKKMTEFMVKSFCGGVLREVVFIVRSIVNCHLGLKRCPAFARLHELRIDKDLMVIQVSTQLETGCFDESAQSKETLHSNKQQAL